MGVRSSVVVVNSSQVKQRRDLVLDTVNCLTNDVSGWRYERVNLTVGRL